MWAGVCALALGWALGACGGGEVRTDLPPAPDAAPVVAAPEGFEFAIELEGVLFSPFERVSYQLRRARGAAVFSTARRYHGGFGEQRAVELIDQAGEAALYAALEACGLEAALSAAANGGTNGGGADAPAADGLDADAAPAAPASQARVELIDVTGRRVGVFAQPDRRATPALYCALDVARRLAAAELGPMGLEMVFVAEAERGHVDLVTSPSGMVAIVDGVPLPTRTPVWRVPVSGGTHTVRFVDPSGEGIDQRFEFDVSVGRKTIFDVELDPPAAP